MMAPRLAGILSNNASDVRCGQDDVAVATGRQPRNQALLDMDMDFINHNPRYFHKLAQTPALKSFFIL